MTITCDTQAYKYIQRPAAPMQIAGRKGSNMPGTRVISGQPIGMGGRARPSTFPPFPQVRGQALDQQKSLCKSKQPLDATERHSRLEGRLLVCLPHRWHVRGLPAIAY